MSTIDCLSNLLITHVRAAYTLYNPSGTRGRRYERPCWAVIMKYEGETIYTAGGKQYLSDASHIIILPKGLSYEWECTADGHFYIVEFDGESEVHEPVVCYVKNSEKILRLFNKVERCRDLKGAMVGPESIRDTYSLILALNSSTESQYAPTDRRQKIAPALEYISENYDKPITNDTLAALADMSTVYFRKLFTSLTGTSPIVYARRLRIDKAKEIIRSDYSTLSEVATSLGYQSLYDFSRDFKKHTGLSPSAYAKKHQPKAN